MLTASQVETVAYIGDGAAFHRECAIREYSTVRIERVDMGLDTGLRPLSRYELDEWQGQEAYDTADDRLDDFEDDHPRLAILLGVNRERRCRPRGGYCGFFRTEGRNRGRLLDRLAEKIPAGPSCDHCGGFLHEPPLRSDRRAILDRESFLYGTQGVN